MVMVFYFFKQKTAYEMRISDWSSDVCSSDLHAAIEVTAEVDQRLGAAADRLAVDHTLHRTGCRHADPGGGQGGEQLGPEHRGQRSEERRVGRACVSTCRSRWSREH